MNESLRVGTTLRDTYTVLEKLGEGAFSEVFLVRHKFLGLQAMKIFKASSSAPTSDQFREAFLLSRIAHPNIVRIFEANKIGGAHGEDRSYVTMEHAAGGTLFELLSSRPRLSPVAIMSIQKEICAGLAAAHSQTPPIIHRDVKPQNILLTGDSPTYTVKIADFGLAKNIDPKLRMASAAGTLLYMPPEGFHHYETPASDVYSAGIIFYEMLTGTFPFAEVKYTTEQEFRLGLAKTRTAAPRPPSSIAGGLDKQHDDVCLRALQPDMHRRFQTASEFLAALNEIASPPVGTNKRRSFDDSNLASAEKARRAMVMGAQYADLPAAVMLLEEALRETPKLVQEYGEVLAKWKAGVIL